MSRSLRSAEEYTIQEVLEWYGLQQQAIGHERVRVLHDLHAGAAAADSRFFGMTPDEIDDFFELHRAHLDDLVMLDMLASPEAAIRIDFLSRVKNRGKDPVSRRFRALRKVREDRISLDEHILDAWSKLAAEARGAVGDFRGALRLRHWRAHGRYWNPKLGRNYTPSDVYDISSALV